MPAIKRQQAHTSKFVNTKVLSVINDRDGVPLLVPQLR